jgi:L-aminopeptidase/D-esterase-like protein
VGKLIPHARTMTGGLGRAEITLADGVKIIAFAVVNAGGDVLDAAGNIIAGAQWEDGTFVNTSRWLCTHPEALSFFQCANTTLVAVFTNAKFSKTELMRINRMAVAGMARAISPLFTCYDGDILFTISLGEQQASVLTTGTAAAEAVRLAIVDAVRTSVVVI